MNIELTKYLISINKPLIEKTSIGDCHCIGLNSFIINETPKIRLFIADNNCELFEPFDFKNPIIPIHSHKYDDLFYTLEGDVNQHLYRYIKENDRKYLNFLNNTFYLSSYKEYTYNRLSDIKTDIIHLGSATLFYNGGRSNLGKLNSQELHTVSLNANCENKCSWIVIEMFKNEDFKQISYHQDLKHRKELYTPIKDPIQYLYNYFDI